MYAIFKHFSKQRRQAAFDRLIEHGYAQRDEEKHGNANCSIKTNVDIYADTRVCPLGMVNITYPQLKRIYGQAIFVYREKYGFHGIFPTMPDDGIDEELLLAKVGIQASAEDAQRFITDNDRGKFDTPEKLARAMGVIYKGE